MTTLLHRAALMGLLLLLAACGQPSGTPPSPAPHAAAPQVRTANVSTTPSVLLVSPSTAVLGGQLTIVGQNFGATRGWSDVTIGGQSVPQVLSWSNSRIVVKIAIGTPTFHGGVTSVQVHGWDPSFGQRNSNALMVRLVTPHVPAQHISGGQYHTLAVRPNGTVAVWGGHNLDVYDYGQATVPPGLVNVVGVSASRFHNLALRSDGTVVAWGRNDHGESSVPSGLKNVVMVSAGWSHSLALRSDGTIVAWGSNIDGETSVPISAQHNVAAVYAGRDYSIALLRNGTVVAWGSPSGGGPGLPTDLTNIVAIAGTAALTSDGRIKVWGNSSGYSPQALQEVQAWRGVTAIAYNGGTLLALKGDGTILAKYTLWKSPDGDKSDQVPAGLSSVVEIAVGEGHGLAVKGDGHVVAWGENYDGQLDVPAGLVVRVP